MNRYCWYHPEEGAAWLQGSILGFVPTMQGTAAIVAPRHADTLVQVPLEAINAGNARPATPLPPPASPPRPAPAPEPSPVVEPAAPAHAG